MLPGIFVIESTILRKVLLLLLAFLFLNTSFSQNSSGSVKGILIDSTSQEPISGATLSLTSEKDSSTHSLTLSSDKGSFQITNLGIGTYTVVITHQSLQPVKKTFSISVEQRIIDFDTIKMERAYKDLGEVIVKDIVPIKVNGDTLAYKADAFKTKHNATVEDLLKKLPGLQVDRSGSVKAQGQQIQKIFVDGKEFFSDDPQLATKNLTADMIDQVQVYNEVSEQSKFNEIDDGSRIKAINLKLKKEKKSGLLGKVYGGVGTYNLYNAGITANYFKGASQLSLIANSKNISNVDNSSGEPGAARTGEGNGITKTSSIGLNYRDALSKSFYVTGSYGYNQGNSSNTRRSTRQTFLTDSTLLTNREAINNNINQNQRVNLNITYTIDSLNSIIYTSNLSIQNSQSTNSDTLVGIINKKGIDYKANDNHTINNSSGMGYNLNNNLLWRKKFNRIGRTFSVNLLNILNTSNRDNYNVNNSRFYNSNGFAYRQRNTDYKINSNNQTNNRTLNLSYTEPISRNKFLEFNYTYNHNRNTSDRKTHNYNGQTKAYDNIVDSLTNDFENVNNYNRIGTNFKGVNKNYNYQFGFAIQQTELQSVDQSKKINFGQHYLNLFPTASVNYKLGKSKNLQINYRGNNNQPTVIQLQDITDISNYPYIRKGNPQLQQEFVNNVTISYNSFNKSKFQNLFAYVTYRGIHNKIVNSITQEAGEQISMPVNSNGIYYISGNFNFGLPLSKMQGGGFNTTTHIDYSRNASIINYTTNFVRNLALEEELSLNYNYEDKLDLGINASISYNSVRYTLQKDQNTSYFTHSYSIDASYTFPHDFIVSTNADYTDYTGRTGGFNQSYILWNASLSRRLFKSKRGELKILVNDILNQNRNVIRNVFDNNIEDVQNITLKRFGIIMFSYRLNQMRG